MSVFLDKTHPPTEKELSAALGPTHAYWKEIRVALGKRCGALEEEWKYYGKSSGWTMKVLMKKRNLFFMAPYEKFFRIAFVFGDKAVAAIELSDLPKTLIRELVEAKRYVEGRGLRLDVKGRGVVKDIVKLVEFKVQS